MRPIAAISCSICPAFPLWLRVTVYLRPGCDKDQDMFGVGFFELVIIGVVALVVVGPKRLPEVMRQAGRLFVHLRRTANDVRSTFEQVIREAEDEMRREEAQSIRQALKPLADARQEVQQLVSGTATPTGIGNPTPSPHAAPAPAQESAHAIAEAPSIVPPTANARLPEHQPEGSKPYNPNGVTSNPKS